MGIGGREDPEADWALTVGLALVGLWVDVEDLWDGIVVYDLLIFICRLAKNGDLETRNSR